VVGGAGRWRRLGFEGGAAALAQGRREAAAARERGEEEE
jgi:hypothetical protein